MCGIIGGIAQRNITPILRVGREVWNRQNRPRNYAITRYKHAAHSLDIGQYRQYMLKELYEQPASIADTLIGMLGESSVLTAGLASDAKIRLKDVQAVHIVACGTSYHAGLVARYWSEEQAGLPCQVKVASEFPYRRVSVPAETLLISISRSGARADIQAGSELPWLQPKPSPRNWLALLWLTTALARERERVSELNVANVTPASDALLEKLKSYLQKVTARGLQMITFSCERADLEDVDEFTHVQISWASACTGPMICTVALQLLSYYVALIKGADVHTPRKSAKSVTIE